MGLRQTNAPAAEPVSLIDAKLHMRVDTSDDDTLIGGLITTARMQVELVECKRALVTQQWDLFLFSFPPVDSCRTDFIELEDSRFLGNGFNARVAVNSDFGRIQLPFPTLQSVEAVQYYDPLGALQTLDPSLYFVDDVAEPGAIYPAPGTQWPATARRPNSVKISYTAGYGAAPAVPAGIKSWMLLRIGSMYENREEIVVGNRLTSVSLPFVDGLLDPYRIWKYV